MKAHLVQLLVPDLEVPHNELCDGIGELFQFHRRVVLLRNDPQLRVVAHGVDQEEAHQAKGAKHKVVVEVVLLLEVVIIYCV